MIEVEFSSSPRHHAGGEVSGTMRFQPDRDLRIKRVNLALGWRTEGRGDKDSAAAAETSQDDIGSLAAGRQIAIPFSFRVPEEGPISYDGKLIRIIWELRVHVDVPWARDIRASFPVRIAARQA